MRENSEMSVSVVMATYNGMQYLQKQLQSILAELQSDDELIIVDDGSQDGTPEFLSSLTSPNVHIVVNRNNIGVFASFERGLLLSSRDVIFLSDQDDIWLLGKRSAFVAEFEQDSKVLIVISDAEIINTQDMVISPSFMNTRRGFDGSVLGTLFRNRYLGCSMAIRRSILFDALPIPSYVPMHDMWFGVIGYMTGKVVYLSSPFLQYRRHSGNVTPSRHQSLKRMIHWRINLLFALCVRILSRKLQIFYLGLGRLISK